MKETSGAGILIAGFAVGLGFWLMLNEPAAKPVATSLAATVEKEPDSSPATDKLHLEAAADKELKSYAAATKLNLESAESETANLRRLIKNQIPRDPARIEKYEGILKLLDKIEVAISDAKLHLTFAEQGNQNAMPQLKADMRLLLAYNNELQTRAKLLGH